MMNRRPLKPFLTAEWKHLAMLNYEIDPAVLTSFVPHGTELDAWNGKTFISVVGFLFLKTRVFGVAIPFHRDFVEVNLRFYVRRKAEDGWRRGVVFIKEIVPRLAIAYTARTFYNEPYVAFPMTHLVDANSDSIRSLSYGWRMGSTPHSLRVATSGPLEPLVDGSEAEFITEHYWGYTRQRDGSTLEYRVEHPRWRVAAATEAALECDVGKLYGEPFVDSLCGKPSSAFVADGSAVTVYRGVRIQS